MKTIAVILASGCGSRLGGLTPKQFIPLAGKPIIQYSIETFEKAKAIDEIIIVTHVDFIDYVRDLIKIQNFNKVAHVIAGGKERYDSTLSALKLIYEIHEAEVNLLIHDAARPFISQAVINDCVAALQKYNAVDVVIDVTDTIVKVDGDIVKDIPPRDSLKISQTPQAFKKTILQKAYNLFMADNHKIASDDCGIVSKYLPDEKIVAVLGDVNNFKITYLQDIYLAESLIKNGLISL